MHYKNTDESTAAAVIEPMQQPYMILSQQPSLSTMQSAVNEDVLPEPDREEINAMIRQYFPTDPAMQQLITPMQQLVTPLQQLVTPMQQLVTPLPPQPLVTPLPSHPDFLVKTPSTMNGKLLAQYNLLSESSKEKVKRTRVRRRNSPSTKIPVTPGIANLLKVNPSIRYHPFLPQNTTTNPSSNLIELSRQLQVRVK